MAVQTKRTSSPASIWLIAIGAAMWGLDAVFIVALLHHFTSTEIVLLEHLLLALFAVPVLIWKRHELKRLNGYDWLSVLFVAWGGSALASILFTMAFNYGNANVILILQKLQPVFAVLLAAAILKEQTPKGLLVLADRRIDWRLPVDVWRPSPACRLGWQRHRCSLRAWCGVSVGRIDRHGKTCGQ